MLDIDICSYAIEQANAAVRRRMEDVPANLLCISIITHAEILFGLAKRQQAERNRIASEKFLRYMPTLPLESEVALHYAEIRAGLQRTGELIGPNDLFVAAHARSLRLTLVTNNVREFGRVPGLQVENWAAA